MGDDYKEMERGYKKGSKQPAILPAKSLQSCPNCIPWTVEALWFSVHRILQARVLEWIGYCFPLSSSSLRKNSGKQQGSLTKSTKEDI